MGTMTMTTTRSGVPGVLDEDTETDLAMELLNVQGEEELDNFLGALIGPLKQIGNKLAPFLKTVAKVGLPLAARAAGTFFGGPAGGAIAGKVGSMISSAIKEAEADIEEVLADELGPEEREDFLGDIVGSLLGGEAEVGSPGERQLAAAKRFVRMATHAAKKLAAQPPTQNPTQAIVSALQSATRKLDGAAKQPSGFFAGHAARSATHGRWVRRGREIVVQGL